MSGYDLIAFDMDGTLLTSKNKVKRIFAGGNCESR